MENFTEVNQPITPKKEIGSILSHAFENFTGTFLYALVFVVIYLLAYFIFNGLLSFLIPGGGDYQNEVMRVMNDFVEDKKYDLNAITELQNSLEAARTTAVMISEVISKSITSALLAPLVVGIIYISYQFSAKKEVEFGDLFIGFRQNTAQIIIYGFITTALIQAGLEINMLIGMYLSFAFFIGLPIVFFENTSAIEGIRKSFSLVHANFITVLVMWLLAGIIAGIGILFCGIGILFTFPFFFTARYSIYSAICVAPYEVKS